MKTYGSFDEWSAKGYTIKRGSKSTFRDEQGVPQFTDMQVKKRFVAASPHPSRCRVNRQDEEANEFREIYGDDAYGVLGADF